MIFEDMDRPRLFSALGGNLYVGPTTLMLVLSFWDIKKCLAPPKTVQIARVFWTGEWLL